MDAFCERTLGLLQLEQQAEEDESLDALKNSTHKELQDKGICILKLRGESSVGFYGRLSMLFKRYMNQPLPPHKLSHGDIVGIFDNERPIHAGKPWAEGVVNKVTPDSIEVIFDGDFPVYVEDKVVNICMVASDVTMKRYRKALEFLGKRETPLTRVCFQNQEPQFVPEDDTYTTFKSPVSEHLNAPQQEAVRRALRAKDLFIIHGPPGTGKTTTCVAFLLECAAREQRVLVCAPSNAAVDNLLIRIVEAGCKNVVRLGHPARVTSELLPFTLDARVQRTDQAELCKDVRQELKAHFAKLNNKKIGVKEKFTARSEIRVLQKELREREKQANDEVLRKSQMVMATCTGAVKAKGDFDVVLIDECAQALEVACWIPLQMARKGILAGDHQQLSATVKSTEAQREGLGLTLFQRMHEEYGDGVAHLLSIQYRMNDVIMGWSSGQFYESKLESAESVKNRTLNDLPPLLFLDTAGQDGYLEEQTAQQVSKMNPGEARLLVHYVKMLRIEDPKCEICCITPYNRQVETIRTMFLEYSDTSLGLHRIPVNSVDSFQGQESDAVIISLVRSNARQEIGFLSDTRRLNVAVTRARKHCVIIGDSSTISSNEVLASLYEYSFEKGQVRFAEQYMELDTTQGCKALLENEESERVTPVQPHKKTSAKPTTATTEPMRMNEEEMDKRRANFRKRLEDALTEGKSVVNFPKGLNACERMLVHDVASAMNLAHESHGEGKKRFVSVRLKDEPGSESAEKGAAMESAPAASSSSAAPPQMEASMPPSYSRSDVPEQKQPRSSQQSKPQQQQDDGRKNELLASLAAERQHRAEARKAEARNMEEQYAEQKKAMKSKSKKKKKGGAKEPAEGDESEEDLDALLHEFTRDDKKCYFLKCKQSVALIADCMRRCRFCSKQYCQEHIMAELHGCGDAVRAHERSKFKEMMTKDERGHGLVNPSCKDIEWKRKLIQDKLHGKIKDKETGRTAKKTENP
eukprot:GEMP01012005.1.p1 GENE.GEMP01012005.1~~GEMP01012005.1.p1  ORF type:complete len:979 (+),score=267.33 GEMP01012005.1:188-3124(+)